METLEANFPQYFAKTVAPPKAAHSWGTVIPQFELHGDRGYASDEVIDSGNQVHCEQAYLDGLLSELALIKGTLINDGGGYFGCNKAEAIKSDSMPFKAQAFANAKKLHREFKRLYSHPELFSSDLVRKRFLKEWVLEAKAVEGILCRIQEVEQFRSEPNPIEAQRTLAEMAGIMPGDPDYPITPVKETIAAAQSPSANKVAVVPESECQPWESWCRHVPGNLGKIPAVNDTLNDFRDKHPELVLVGLQLIPYMGVLIAEHHRKKVEEVVVGITQFNPATTARFPDSQKMVSNSKLGGEGEYAVLRFPIGGVPPSARTGYVFAFGPRENIAAMARTYALWSRDVTRLGHPTAVLFGTFCTPEEAEKYPEYEEL